MNIAAIILAFLKLAFSFLSWAKERQLLDAGYDRAVAEQALKVIKATEAGKQIKEHVDAMSGSDLDILLRSLAKD